MAKKFPMDGFLNTSWNPSDGGIPIRILDIDDSKPFPVKFEYKEVGYKRMHFHERKSNIIFMNSTS